MKDDQLPGYTALQENPTRSLPPGLRERERSSAFDSRLAQLRHALREPSARPHSDAPLLIAIQDRSNEGTITITPGGGQPQCVPVFTAPIRAADYRRVLLPPQLDVRYIGFSPSGFVRMLRGLEEADIRFWTLDRCPRCDVFTVVGTSDVKTPEDAVTIWEITRAQELARLELYLAYAVELARAGRLEAAREVALETAGHVTLEHPDTHLLLGEIAIAMGDGRLLIEAKAFLHAQGAEAWEGKLDEAQRSGALSFREYGH